ncbi:SUMF1/EgtB/PvdO family nonheme iron enzyme [Hymenobacter jeollabukensis]|uniref:Sulfatase-modifying factor enzyme-like domain-containing protein n=1 Tax=Hymenobacter jeollabukensis TaxID=2025313 RepID=A0A5R8WW12_9BACT|nr:SUMF1/EgtB/PvdO family nonheme iron enzyme [Hymenobacter jeollabukensis]TLM96717.1 hypothetical protein FDY95_01605 [Hymenobacter jeollabukensis]
MPLFSRQLLILLTDLLLLSGCVSIGPPSSISPGLYAATTGLPATGSRVWTTAAGGINDFNVLKFHPGKATDERCRDTLTFSYKELQHTRLPQAPGIVPLPTAGLGIDEAEVSVLEWKRYQELTAPAGQPLNPAVQPLAPALPVPAYYTDAFYHRFPIVGISREQAQVFCRWRSRVVTQAYNTGNHLDSLNRDYVRFEYRLPTEAEWELAAAAGGRGPWGVKCISIPVRVNPSAAAYLQRRSGSTASVEQIAADIKAYNQRQPARDWVSYAQAEPYFLRLASPAYVWQGPPNDFGLYQMFGNAAELVQEPGLTKGGSYQDQLTACTVRARGSYSGPAPTVGFRCVCEASYPNRK